MDIYELAKKLNIPAEIAEGLRPVPEAQSYLKGLCSEAYESAANALHEALGADMGGLKMLSAMLEGALLTREEYARRGISEEIFFATMGCFPRFIREHKESFGCYGFDRWWWTGRQLSLSLFRIGCLEYELCAGEGGRAISLHIPSDADLSDDAVDASVQGARAFLQEYFSQYGGAKIHCHSWLLAPALGELLPAESNINRFRMRFEILGVDENAEDYKLWVFKNNGLALDEFPVSTTLQRRMKAFLMQGGKVGCAWGILRERSDK